MIRTIPRSTRSTRCGIASPDGVFPAGLEPGALYEGRDLPVTTDFRAVFCELAGKHLGVQDDARLFPGWTGGRVALVKA